MVEKKFKVWNRKIGVMSEPFRLGEVMTGKIGAEDISDLDFIQYTGMKDRNGVEIWEGNILRSHMFDGRSEFRTIGAVSFLEGSFTLCPQYCDPMDNDYLTLAQGLKSHLLIEGYEVVGNVYENPELLANVE